MTSEATPDRIQKTVVLRAPRSRVWRAISDAKEFGAWFGMKVEGEFVAGRTVKASVAPTQADPEIAKEQEKDAGVAFEIDVERVEPERAFAFRWVPYEPGPEEPDGGVKTLVTFELEETAGGVRLTVTESGFDRVPLDRRAKAFASNEQGWAIQTRLVERYLAQVA